MTRIYFGKRNFFSDLRQLEIQYYMLVEQAEKRDGRGYGIQVVSVFRGKTTHAVIRGICAEYDECRDLLERLKRSAVTAITARDVISDILWREHTLTNA